MQNGKIIATAYPLPGERDRVRDLRDPVETQRENIRRKVSSSGRPWEEKAGYSRAVRVGGLVEIGLTSPSAPDGSILHAGDVYRQTRESLKIVGEALEQAGASFADVVKTNIMMLDTGKWAEAGRAHAEVLGEARPALSFVGVSGFFDPLIEVEVEVTAYIDPDRAG
jgi:enamine deaminase RidA (YjgF/YER057c/UK114 family)